MTLKYIWRSFQPRLSFPRPFQLSLTCFRIARSPSNSWASCIYSSVILYSWMSCYNLVAHSSVAYWRSMTAVVTKYVGIEILVVQGDCNRWLYSKVTIHPKFFRTVPNFEGLSQKSTRSFGTLNCPEFRILSGICPNLTSRCVAVQAVDQNAVDHFDVFACQRCVLLS